MEFRGLALLLDVGEIVYKLISKWMFIINETSITKFEVSSGNTARFFIEVAMGLFLD